MKTTKRLVALLLAAVMVLGMMPVSASAAQRDHIHTHGIEEYPEIEVGASVDVAITTGGEYAYFKFTPEVTDLYYFYSAQTTDYSDTFGYIYDAEGNELVSNDDAAWGNALSITSPNFMVSYVMEAGTTYVLAARLYSAGRTGAFAVSLVQGHEYESAVTKEMTCAEDGVLTYTCKHCGDSYTEAIPSKHVYGTDGNCVSCGEAYLVEGTCGDSLTWKLVWDGTLTISGTGAMYNYSNDYSNPVYAPWNDYRYKNEDADGNKLGAYIQKVVVEDGVTSIGNYAFYQCNELVEVQLADSVTSLGDSAFSNCYVLKAITIPTNVTAIPKACFSSCGELATVSWNKNLTTIGDNAFYGVAIGNTILPEGITTLGQYAFGGCSNLTELTLPTTLTNVADYAFASMWSTKDIIFKGDAPTFGGSNVFYWVTANAWYPLGNESWTDEVKQNYGGTITWSGMCADSHSWGEAVTVPATCTTGSYMTMTCTACGYVAVSPENDDALDHDYQTEHYNGGCGDSSYDIITCSRCDYYVTENWVWNEHDYVQTHVDATCEIGGYDVYTCSLCSDFYETNYTTPLGHDVAEWSEPTEATCTEDGVKTGTCARCEQTVSEVVTAKLGHEWDMENGVENADGTTTYSCIRCDATYTTEGSFLIEGDNQFTIEANAGSEIKTYTATAGGTLTIYVSDLTYDNGDGGWNTMAIDYYVKTMGAISIKVNGESASYTVEGKETAAKLILNAIEVQKDDVVTVELAHTSESWHTNKDVRFNVNLALDHTHEYTAVVTDPTCTEGGYTTYTCSCGDSYTADETDSLGHSYDSIFEATCNNCGEVREIAVASEQLTGITGEGSSVDTTEEGHDKSVGNAFDGDYNTYWATVPGGNLADAYLIADLGGVYTINQVKYTKRFDSGALYNCTGNLLNYVIEVSDDGTTWTPVANGDTNDGTTEITFAPVHAAYVRLTSTSSYHWQASNANTVMCAAELEIFKAVCGHIAAEPVVDNVVAATCTSAGSYESVVYCSVCGEEMSRETVEIPVLEHNYEAVVTAPTCTAGGYTTYTCSACGDSYTADETAALEHNYEAVVTAPTCTEGGYTTYTCSACGDTYTADETEPAHTYDNEYDADCNVCGETREVEVNPDDPWGKSKWVKVEVDTETIWNETEGKFEYAWDGDLNTIWHSDWKNGHDVLTGENTFTGIIDFTQEHYINQFSFTPRQDYTYWENGSGVILQASLYVKDADDTEWKCVGEHVVFEHNQQKKTFHFEAQNVRYVKFVAEKAAYMDATNDDGELQGWVAVAEFDIDYCDHTNTENRNAVEATCGKDGYTGDTYCVDCGVELAKGETIPATGNHTEESIPAVAATCTAPGLTEGTKCSVCDEILVAQEETPALGHDWKGLVCQRCDEVRENPFSDVSEEHHADFIAPIMWAVDNGITTGTNDGTTFSPTENCQRATVVTFLWRAAGKPTPTITENPFSDVVETDFFYEAVLWAVEEGITDGIAPGIFAPYQECNRAQVVTFLWRYEGKPEPTTKEHPFTDVNEEHFGPFYDAILWAVGEEVTNGLTADTFGPKDVCNRAQVVTFLYRAQAE